MTRADDRDPAQTMAGLFPVGDYSRERTVAAAEVAAEAIRYLNHATGSDPQQALPDPVACAELTSRLHTLTSRLPQLLHQVAAETMSQAGHPRLTADGYADPPSGGVANPVVLAGAAIDDLETAADVAEALSDPLGTAQQHLSRLYLYESTEVNDATDGW
jgi:hypothetical protein